MDGVEDRKILKGVERALTDFAQPRHRTPREDTIKQQVYATMVESPQTNAALDYVIEEISPAVKVLFIKMLLLTLDYEMFCAIVEQMDTIAQQRNKGTRDTLHQWALTYDQNQEAAIKAEEGRVSSSGEQTDG